MWESIVSSEHGWGKQGQFDEIRHLIEEAEKQYGLANFNYTDYVVELFEYTITKLCVLIITYAEFRD